MRNYSKAASTPLHYLGYDGLIGVPRILVREDSTRRQKVLKSKRIEVKAPVFLACFRLGRNFVVVARNQVWAEPFDHAQIPQFQTVFSTTLAISAAMLVAGARGWLDAIPATACHDVAGFAPNTVCHHFGFDSVFCATLYPAPSIITLATVV